MKNIISQKIVQRIIAFSVLRHHTGGVHAPTQISCIICSCLLGISNWLIIKYIPCYTINVIYMFFCGTVCALFAPTDISKYEISKFIQKKEKLCSLGVLVVGFIIAILLRNSISISILYADVCVCMLILIKLFVNKLLCVNKNR